MEINGIAHVFLTVSDFAACRPFYVRLLGFLGRFAWQKGPEIFLQAAALVAGRCDHADFILAGSGELEPGLRRLAGEGALAGRVFFPGFVAPDGIPGLLGHVDVLAMSSRAEPFGLVALEAAAAGLPVVVPATAGVAEVLPAALTVPPEDAAALAAALRRLLDDAPLRRRLGEANRRAAAGQTWGRAARRLVQLYRSLGAGRVAASSHSR